MSNPFVYDKPLRTADLVDREAHVATLRAGALERRNCRLEGPRRFGKTSLLRAGLAAAELDGAIVIEVDFFGCVTSADVAERIERAYSSQLDGRLRRWLAAALRTMRPTLSLPGVDVSPQVGTPGLLDRLALPLEVHKRTERHVVVAFDEFQEVVRIHPALPGVFRAEIEAHGEAAAYIFSGSHPGLMRELFADRRHAFFAQAKPLEVGPLSPEPLADYVGGRFEAAGRDVGAVLGPLLDAAEGHPQRAMLLSYHLYERTPQGQSADAERWAGALAAAAREAAGEIGVLWESSSTMERRVLKVIAARTVPLAGKEARQRFGLIKSGSAQQAVARLAGEGHLIADDRTRTGWRVVDPLLGAWLRGEVA